MAPQRSFSTTLLWHDSRGEECAVDVTVTYAFYRGHTGDQIDPPEPDSVEIVTIKPADREPIPARFFYDEDLLAECMERWREDVADIADRCAEQRRDDLMMERF